MSLAKVVCKVARVTVFSRFDGDVAFGFTMPNKNKFNGAMIFFSDHLQGLVDFVGTYRGMKSKNKGSRICEWRRK